MEYDSISEEDLRHEISYSLDKYFSIKSKFGAYYDLRKDVKIALSKYLQTSKTFGEVILPNIRAYQDLLLESMIVGRETLALYDFYKRRFPDSTELSELFSKDLKDLSEQVEKNKQLTLDRLLSDIQILAGKK